jgi:Na+/melibiose symporter-like transporter
MFLHVAEGVLTAVFLFTMIISWFGPRESEQERKTSMAMWVVAMACFFALFFLHHAFKQ